MGWSCDPPCMTNDQDQKVKVTRSCNVSAATDGAMLLLAQFSINSSLWQMAITNVHVLTIPVHSTISHRLPAIRWATFGYNWVSHLLTKWRSTESALESLSHCQVAAVCERSLHQFLLHAEVLKAVVELGVGHMDAQLLQHVGVLRVKVESHLREPVERLRVGDAILYEHASDVSLMNQLCNLHRTHHRD